jgi:ribosomal protein S6--L-glutamate ligase
MKILILSSDPGLYSTSRIKEAARARGHTVRVLSVQSFALDIKSGNPDILFKGKSFSKVDAVIPRIAASQSAFGTALLRQFEQMGIYCLNPSFALTVSRDKLRSMQVLSRHNIGIPPSAFVFNKSEVEPALDRLGGVPVIIKLLEGTQGAGVMLAENVNIAKAIIQAFQVAKNSVLIQRFVAESKGSDIRAFVIGGRVVAAMRRVAQEGEFRSNVHLGADVESVTLTEEYERAAILAAQIMGLRVAGVDILQSNSGPQILEVNSSPGLEGIEKASGVDIATEIINYIEQEVSFPYIDIREKLSLAKGYTIAEFVVSRNLPFVNQSIEESRLLEQEIQILSITRDSIVIPAPRSTEVLHLGDKLLCFAKHGLLQALLPEKKIARKKKDS